MRKTTKSPFFRLLAFLLTACMLLSSVTLVGVSAADEEEEIFYYVNSETGDDAANGRTANNAVKTFTRACNLAKRTGGTIVVTNEYVFPKTVTEVKHDLPFVITTNDGEVDYGAQGAKLVFGSTLRYVLNGETTFRDIAIDYEYSLVVVANYHPITFDTGVKTTLKGEGKGIYVIGGYQSPADTVDTTLDSHITVKSGDYYVIVGGSRQKGTGATGTAYSGTSYLDISGGKIEYLYGGPLSNQIGHSTVINVSGGEIKNCCTGGDVTRRLDGNATVNLTGGSIENLDVNNVIGKADITIAGAKIGSAAVRYQNETLAAMAKKANEKKTLCYDAHYYTAEQIAAFGETFDKVENITNIYASQDGSGDGTSESKPASFAAAFETAAKTNGNVVVVGKISLVDFAEPAHTETIVVKGADKNAKLELAGSYTLGGETVFEALALGGDSLTFHAEKGKLKLAADVTLDGKADIVGSAALYTGVFGKIVAGAENQSVLIDGAEVDSVVGGTAATKIELADGKIGEIRSTDTSIASFDLAITGGSVEKVVLANITKSLNILLYGGSVGAWAVEGQCAKGTLTLDETKFTADSLGAAAELFTVSEEKVYFLKDGGTGSGTGAATAGGSLADAYTALKDSGGTIVLCDEYTITAAFIGYTNAKKITITSLYDGVDYRKTADAKLTFKGNFYCGGETEFDHVLLANQKSYGGIYGNLNKLVIGSDVECKAVGAVTTVPSIIAGSNLGVELTDADKQKSADLTISSGTWQRVRGGSSAGGYSEFDIKITVNGGTFKEKFMLASATSHTGNIDLTVNGGTFLAGIYYASMDAADQAVSGNVGMTFNDGTVYGMIAPAVSNIGSFSGSYNVVVNGGDFTHLTDLVGTADLANSTMTSSLHTGENFDINAEISGTMTFQNPIRSNGADPWLFFHNGCYYYIATGGTALYLYKAANIGDLATTYGTVIYKPESGKAWSKNLWSPEIHYFSAEDVGEADAGWYCFLGSDSGTDSGENAGFGGQRAYVIKCLDGDNLLGRWGNPLTGEANVPQKIEFPDSDFNDKELCGGCSVIIIGGQKYITFISEVGRETSGTPNVNFYQTINIAKFDKPWRISGQPKVICRSEYDWEKGGSEDGIHPQVVEGSTAVYGSDGSVYIVYSGSGYWTTLYQLGQMKYIGGDPTDAASWQKSPTPIFSKSDKLNGCGHASYVTDTDGQGWICYHAYKGTDTQSGRFAYVEPYKTDANGVVIGNGSTHPEDPAKVYTVNVNKTPLGKKVSGFGKVDGEKVSFAYTRLYGDSFTDVTAAHWFYSFVRDAYRIGLANGTSATKFSPDTTFTVAQAITAAANIHSIYYGKTVNTAGAARWYDPYVNYCVENGIIKAGQFASYDANITRGDMAIVFANILPDSEYAAVRDGSNPDVTSGMACFDAVRKLFNAGIVGGDAGTGNFRPNDSIKRSEACVIFTRIALKGERAK